jgi:guanylate kinase
MFPAPPRGPFSDMTAGKLIVLTGPSGVGKGTLLQALLKRHPEIYLSTSATTRSPREGESDGVQYYFYTRDRFTEGIEKGEFLEWAEFAGNYYGTPLLPVQNQLQSGRSIMLEIEVEGARQIAKIFPDALTIFILPPNMAELEARIRHRGTEDEAAIARRLDRAVSELAALDEFKAQITNDDFDRALDRLDRLVQ